MNRICSVLTWFFQTYWPSSHSSQNAQISCISVNLKFSDVPTTFVFHDHYRSFILVVSIGCTCTKIRGTRTTKCTRVNSQNQYPKRESLNLYEPRIHTINGIDIPSRHGFKTTHKDKKQTILFLRAAVTPLYMQLKHLCIHSSSGTFLNAAT